ncbi:LSU ribosomal protein L1P [Candidatus Nanobsidianus stetteri]|uniref:Ribosomal protein n=1 Tax=Nanobsidianus stetteri TaxID=1294122 RepID=R1G2A2_NANST|nr:LSU ribosomal protein L1P [Candidatus Nanobsidianus stetteri]
MDVKNIQSLIEKSKKRRFKQTVELIINLKKEYDLNKSENRFTEYVELPKGRGKKVKIAAVVGPELEKSAKEIFDFVLVKDKIKEIAENKREAKKLVRRYYIFVAQASTMADLGRYLGKYLSTKNRMPNPKYGMIIPDNANQDFLRSIYNRLQNMVRVVVKNHKTIGIPIGTEDMKYEDILENANHVLEYFINRVPGNKNSIKSVYIKLTMSDSIRIM